MTMKVFLLVARAVGILCGAAVCLHSPAGVHFMRSLHSR